MENLGNIYVEQKGCLPLPPLFSAPSLLPKGSDGLFSPCAELYPLNLKYLLSSLSFLQVRKCREGRANVLLGLISQNLAQCLANNRCPSIDAGFQYTCAPLIKMYLREKSQGNNSKRCYGRMEASAGRGVCTRS